MPKMPGISTSDNVPENHLLGLAEVGWRRELKLRGWNDAQGGGGNSRHRGSSEVGCGWLRLNRGRAPENKFSGRIEEHCR